jgi:hypothetical protein
MKSPTAWTGNFRGSPTKWKEPDGETVVRAIQEAQVNPIIRPYDQRKLKYRPKAIKTEMIQIETRRMN